jgi:hypothetical protein
MPLKENVCHRRIVDRLVGSEVVQKHHAPPHSVGDKRRLRAQAVAGARLRQADGVSLEARRRSLAYVFGGLRPLGRDRLSNPLGVLPVQREVGGTIAKLDGPDVLAIARSPR